MSVVLASREQELERLYQRYKALTLATTAALILERPLDDLALEADRLRGECRSAAASAAGAAELFDDCICAAGHLGELLRLASLGVPTSAQLDRVRASHRRLRRQVWDLHACEYVPCCVSEVHQH
jgi:hypothetical protein